MYSRLTTILLCVTATQQAIVHAHTLTAKGQHLLDSQAGGYSGTTNPLHPSAVTGGKLSRAGAWIWCILLWVLFTAYCVFAFIQVMWCEATVFFPCLDAS